MMQLENVVGQTQQRPFYFYFNGAAEKEPSKPHVFLDHGEHTLGLDAAVDADQLSLSRVDAFLHLSPLPCETLGYIDDLTALCQRLLTAAGPDAFLFLRAAGTVLAAVNGGLQFKATLRFGLLYAVEGERLPAGAGVGICFGVICHVLSWFEGFTYSFMTPFSSNQQ